MRRLARFAGWALAGLGGTVALALVLPLAFGARPYTVLTGSMEPAIAPGDVVVARSIRPADARPGDVVTFADPGRGGRLVTHRVRSSQPAGDRLSFVTAGDANSGSERWTVAASDEIGRVAYRVPAVGAIATRLAGGGGLLLVVAGPLLLLAAHELWRVWRPREGGDHAPA